VYTIKKHLDKQERDRARNGYIKPTATRSARDLFAARKAIKVTHPSSAASTSHLPLDVSNGSTDVQPEAAKSMAHHHPSPKRFPKPTVEEVPDVEAPQLPPLSTKALYRSEGKMGHGFNLVYGEDINVEQVHDMGASLLVSCNSI
jgi:hypothetical protein